MKVSDSARRKAVVRAKSNRVEWAIARHYRQHPGACNLGELLSAVREIRAAGFEVSMSLKINGRTIR